MQPKLKAIKALQQTINAGVCSTTAAASAPLTTLNAA